ncbi:MAG: prepilin-type N-terminal cleavage/methylation domain-containing protein [Candidatus Omnitrophota bacterium]
MLMPKGRVKRGFTLMELVIVVIIIGILITLAIVQFGGPTEIALDKEARANLKLIAAAEKIYRMEIGTYVKANNESQINERLRLLLPATGNKKWEYKVVTDNDNTTFTINGTRTQSDGRTWSFNETSEEAYNSTAE